VRYLTDTNGVITDTFDYDAFGNLIARTGSTPNNFLFTSEQLDPDLGLYYLRARYHDPSTGRFWTMDEFQGSSGEPLSLHKYLYVGNDAVNSIDPSGHGFISLASTVFTTGLRQLFTKLQYPHTRTAIFFVGGYALGYGLGVQGPDVVIGMAQAAGVSIAVVSDTFVRGVMWSRHEVARTLNVSLPTAVTVAMFFYRYIQPVTFISTATTMGFSLGYATGMLYYYNSRNE
jgi:RHS repeat-associated protein